MKEFTTAYVLARLYSKSQPPTSSYKNNADIRKKKNAEMNAINQLLLSILSY